VQPLSGQVAELFILAIPVASLAWTVTHEEIFREPREWCTKRSKTCQNLLQRKFFYLFTCEYCFSHYVTLLFLFLTGFKLLFDDWRGYIVAGFSLVWVANVYMSSFGRLRQEVKSEKLEAKRKEKVLERVKLQVDKEREDEPEPVPTGPRREPFRG